ncbi:alanine racemase domain-containing protein [Moraxella macacae 0408225]|uniref:Pyridoxal phosphate homeostasis protein n=1 Tax=Moraxella macacae 0408225 TaxID=1230338 RepID=L2F5P0_9GAMM|nr:YggS family pyridoxal phosphate-dependent enzyme [Moraxella macacae]ELA08210.1 alanine racemase domain-containing protein [Moraxella macacae 0408225]
MPNNEPVLNFISNKQLIQNYEQIKQKIPSHVTLLAVSKTKPSEMIQALAKHGQRDFGENYVQEALAKIHALQGITAKGKALIWHYIGHIQRNKTRDLAENFDWVHGVDRLIIAQRLNEQRPKNLAKLNICIQVNIDNEDNKSGCQPEELPTLVAKISQFGNLCLRGLMIIPNPTQDSKHAFEKTKQLFDKVKQCHANPTDWDTLSMGMSGDIEQAIDAGSNMVRVGTAIFGARNYA